VKKACKNTVGPKTRGRLPKKGPRTQTRGHNPIFQGHPSQMGAPPLLGPKLRLKGNQPKGKKEPATEKKTGPFNTIPRRGQKPK